MVLHFIGPREFPVAHGTWKDFTLRTLVVEERMSLEAVFVLECLLDIFLEAFRALVDAFADLGVTEEVQTAYGHFGELFGWIVKG